MQRWRQLYKNAGKSGVAKTLIVGLIFLVIGFGNGESASAGILFVVGLLAPRLLRKVMISHLSTSFAILRYFGMAIFGLVLIGQSFKESLPEVALIHGLCGTIGLYLGLYFWLLSDPEVEVIETTSDPDSKE